MAGLFGLRAFAAETIVALQQRRAAGAKGEVEGEILGGNIGAKLLLFHAQRPTFQRNIQHLGGGTDAEAGAGGTLIMAQPAERGVGDGGVGKQNLRWGKLTAAGFTNAGAIAEKRELKAECLAAGGLQMPGGIPPFGAKRRVRAVIAWKGEGGARQDVRKLGGLCAGKIRHQQCGNYCGDRAD